MSKFLNICLLIISLLVTSSMIYGGTVADDLDLKIRSAPDEQLFRVLIVLADDNLTPSLKSSLSANYPKRADRHRIGMERLQAQAAISQKPVISILSGLRSNNRARSIKPLWIANMIEAEVAASEIYKLALSSAVDKIYGYPEIVSIPVPAQKRSSDLSLATGPEPNLISVKADSAWALGFDGSGRLVCSFDSGVDGAHPALSGNYRGNFGYPANECWFSPTDSSDFPHAFSYPPKAYSHGTHTTGIMIGHDDATGDTIGIAPGAQWIAAVAIDIPGVSIFEAFQWAADPDGDPNTVSDLPDVINHSWGAKGIGCASLFWDVIDNVEALGIVNIFAAGNEGPIAFSIRNPANRAEDSITNFAVGAINIVDSALWSASSQGPSDCDSVSIKPNITAPGADIISSVPNNGYAEFSGTSMAAPHISGAVAILRQKNPDATVDEIKTALLNSAYDFGPAGPDNAYGWGILDIMEAMRQIDSLTSASIRVEQLNYPEIMPGDVINTELYLINVGANASNIVVHFDLPDPELILHTDSILYYDLATDVITVGDRTLDLEFSDFAEEGRFYSLDMFILIDGTLHSQKRLSFFVGSKGERTYFHHDTGLVKFTISNFGAYGFHGNNDRSAVTGSFIPLGFEGFKYDRVLNDLYEGALLIGVDANHVSDCARNIGQDPDNDFAIQPGGSIQSFSPGLIADQETISLFDDSWAENPIGLLIQQKTFGWADPPYDGFIIFEYVITNVSGGFIGGIRTGLFFDWDITKGGSNHGSFLPDMDLTYLCYATSSDSADFRGVRVLNPEGLTNHFIFRWSDIGGSSLTEAKKYKALTDNSSETFSPLSDVSHVTTTGSFDLAAGQSDTAVFAVVAGKTWNEFIQNADRAYQKYTDLPTDADDFSDLIIPREFSLAQNFPNPFNPTTTISFAVPRSGQAEVVIFDILGRKVRTVFHGSVPAGEMKLVWDGLDQTGHKAATGIYFYRVRYENGSLTKKMILMK